MYRLRPSICSKLLLILIVFQFSLSFYYFDLNSFHNDNSLINLGLGNLKPESQDLVNDNGHTDPIIGEDLKKILSNETVRDTVKIIVKSSQKGLAEAMEFFKPALDDFKVINSSFYSIFSGTIITADLKNLIKSLPPSVEEVRLSRRSIPTMKYVNRQLRVFPYIRNTYQLKGDPQTSVAVLDSGVDGSHPALKDKINAWKDFFNEYAVPTDNRSHGTPVASIACGNPWNTTDELGRTLFSERYFYDWTGANLDSKSYIQVLNAFIASKTGNISLEGTWFKEASGTAKVISFQLINQSGTVVKEVETQNQGQLYNFNYEINETNYGIYSFRYMFNVTSNEYPAYVINATIHLPEENSNINDTYSGVAPNCKLVALRCVGGGEFEIIEAMKWVIDNKEKYNITSVVMSFRMSGSSYDIRYWADRLVDAGLVVSCAGGNDGYLGDAGAFPPGNADKVLSVGATNQNSSLAEYSSQGGLNPTKHVIKPDILAPGGVKWDYTYQNLPIYAADSNDGEFLGDQTPSEFENLADIIKNDTFAVSGTSFSAPVVAGISQLLIEALGGIDNWNYTGQNALFIKNLLLMTATETWPNPRLNISEGLPGGNSPTLDRGGKDIHEGYGKINPDAAIDALLQPKMAVNSTESSYLSSIPMNNESDPYCWARRINLPRNFYNITLEVPEEADFDFYIYDYQGDQYGEPVILKKLTTNQEGGKEEVINWTRSEDGRCFLVVKGVNGSGIFNLSFYKSPKYFDKIPPVCEVLLPLNDTLLNETILLKGRAIDNYSGIKQKSIIIQTPSRQISFPFLTPEVNFSTLWTSKKRDNGLCSIYVIAMDGFNNTAISNYTYFTIFNDDIPPVIEWLSPNDKSSILGQILLRVKIQDEHSKEKNATIQIRTPNNYYHIEFTKIGQEVEYRWQPAPEDDGPCYINVSAYDTNYNEGYSMTLLVFPKNGMVLNNTIIISLLIMLAAMVIFNKYSKRLLTNEPLMQYLQDLSSFMRNPDYKHRKKIHPFRLFTLERHFQFKIKEINNLILRGRYQEALGVCEQLLNTKFPIARKKSSRILDVLLDVRYELIEKIRKKA